MASKGCTGFFIDKYGTVMTASHCVRPIRKDKHNPHGEYHLKEVHIYYGSFSKPQSYFQSRIKDLSRIKHHSDSVWVTRNPYLRFIDIAIVFASKNNDQEDLKLDCGNGTVNTIRISSKRDASDFTRIGIVAGFGLEGITENGCLVRLMHTDSLSRIKLKYDGRLDGDYVNGLHRIDSGADTPYFSTIGTGKKAIKALCRRQVNPNNRGNVTAGPSTVLLDGICEEDSGAPYMMMEGSTGNEQLHARGVVSGMGLLMIRPLEIPCAELGEANVIMDLNYNRTTSWLSSTLGERYKKLGVLPEHGSWDGNPIGC